MNQFIFYYFLFLTLMGVGLTALLIFFSFRRNSRLIDALALFYGFYTLNVSLGIFNKYLKLDMQEFYVVFFDLAAFGSLIGRAILLWSILYLFVQLIPVKRSRLILAGYTIILTISFIVPGVLIETIILPVLKTQFHKVDSLDVAAFILFFFIVTTSIVYRKSVIEAENRLLTHGIGVILGFGLVLVILEGLHLIPRIIPVNSVVFMMFTLLLVLFLFRYGSFRTNYSQGESAIADPQGLDELELNRREKEVMALLIKGRSNKEIAKELFISISSVKSHINNIFKKMCVKNRWELISKHKASL